MTREIYTLREDAATWYSSILADAADALLTSSYEHALEVLAPIAGEIWMGSFPLHGKTADGVVERSSRDTSPRTRAQVCLRDGFVCS